MAKPELCLEQCRKFDDPQACLNLALALQTREPEAPAKFVQSLFAQACALAEEGGCTNRGAGIRNGGYEDDPFARRTPREARACQFRTFDFACSKDDAWGCAMLGQAYAAGEGVAKDRNKANIAFSRACAQDPKFAACDFAKEHRGR